MTIAAQSIVRRVVETLQDSTSVRWPISELVRYLNDGQREVVLYRPDSMVTNAVLTCVAGTRQTLPSAGSKLIEIVRNVASTSAKKAVRMINREILDAQTPGWHGLTGVVDITHFMYDPRDPRTFYVYPPATTSAQLDVVYAAYPTDITEPADGTLYGSVSGNISLPDIYGNVLGDYILYRAYTKDSEYAGNAQRAQAHYGAFANALGIEIKGTTGVMPVSAGNPNRANAPAG
jgi:hypothetical protein